MARNNHAAGAEERGKINKNLVEKERDGEHTSSATGSESDAFCTGEPAVLVVRWILGSTSW